MRFSTTRQRTKGRFRSRALTHFLVAFSCGLIGWGVGRYQAAISWYISPTIPPEKSFVSSLDTETVMVVGGSMAHGWKDPHDNSYIRRAFSALTNSTNTQYIYVDHTIIGGTAASMQQTQPEQYRSWLKQDRPQIVVISWGLLDDIYNQTPLKDFNQAIHDEIQQALAAHAVVILVTPPVVEATATAGRQAAEKLIANEIHVAEQFHNPNVYTFNLFAQMWNYMQAHGQTYQMYYGDNWHPNSAGHQLAGQILRNDLVETFGQSPIRFISGRGTHKPAK